MSRRWLALALVYTCTITRRGTMIALEIDFPRRPIDIYPGRGAAPRSGTSINWGLGRGLGERQPTIVRQSISRTHASQSGCRPHSSSLNWASIRCSLIWCRVHISQCCPRSRHVANIFYHSKSECTPQPHFYYWRIAAFLVCKINFKPLWFLKILKIL